MTIKRNSSNTKLTFKRVRLTKISTLMVSGFKIPRITNGQGFISLKKPAERLTKKSTLRVNGFKIPKITNRQGFITLKKAADDKVHFTKPSTKQFHGFVIPTIDTTQRPTKAKKNVRFSPHNQTFYFEQDKPKNSIHAASI